MIPTKTYDKAITSGTADTAQASISLTPEMYELLSAGIYEDRPLAIVRELTCNARDAQVDAGNGDRAIKIHLPNPFEPYFSVRDFGTGLSHDDVFNIYLTYGASTKRDSNEQVGMFGIGSKSPLSYTDSFLVTSYMDGLETQYNIYKDNGIPKIAKLVELPTTEENGLKVTVAIRSQDFSTFITKVQTFGKLFDQELDIDGASVDMDVTYTEQNDLYHLVTGYQEGAYALMGGVPYRLSEEIRRQLREDLLVNTIILPFELGALNIASSRENLSFNEGDATDQAIKDRVEKIKEVFMTNMENTLKACETISEVVKTLYNDYGMRVVSYYSNSTNMDHITWNGKTIKEWRLGMAADDATKHRQFRSGKESIRKSEDFGLFKGYENTIAFFDGDRKTGNIKAVKQYSKNNSNVLVLFDVDPIDKARIEDYHGDIDTVSCEDVYEDLFPKVEGQKSTIRKVSGVYLLQTDKDGYSRVREVKEIDGTETGYYVDMFRDVVTINNTSSHMNEVFWLVEQGIVEKLWFIRGTAAKKNRPENVLKLDTEIDKLISNKINRKMIKKTVVGNVWEQCNSINIPADYVELVEAGLFNDFPTLNFYNDKLKRNKVLNSGVNANKIINNLRTVGSSAKLDKVIQRLRTDKARILKRYNKEYSDFMTKNALLFAAIQSRRFEQPAKEQLIALLKKEL